ncbi:hypothetical protein IKT18_03260 [Candidatus Saccharibacteria bacterium]|nr:hypothetical protein [Candidatus Saccharibacteria bacterium]
MDNQATTEIDPWANMGNMGPQRPQNNEVSAENLKRAEEWNQAMQDSPAFSGETQPQPATVAETPIEANPQPLQNNEERDGNISDAEAILFQGPINAAAKEKGVDVVVQGIKNFVYSGQGDPMKQLLTEIGVNTQQEKQELAEESQAIKPAEAAFREENINAPTAATRSEEGTLSAIQEFKELIAEVESSEEYAPLRANAMKYGKSIWEEAISEYDVRDLTTLFDALSKQKASAKETMPPQEPESQELEPTEPTEITEETIPTETLEAQLTEEAILRTPKPEGTDQTTNQSSTENPAPETDATASMGF